MDKKNIAARITPNVMYRIERLEDAIEIYSALEYAVFDHDKNPIMNEEEIEGWYKLQGHVYLLPRGWKYLDHMYDLTRVVMKPHVHRDIDQKKLKDLKESGND